MPAVVVYKYRGQYWLTRWAGDPPTYLSTDDADTSEFYAAFVWGTEVAHWGDD